MVFAKDFRTALASIESEGDIDFKEMRQAIDVSAEPEPGDEPDARIDLTLVEKEGNVVKVIGIVVGILALVTLLAVGPYLAYRSGHRRGSQGQAV